MTKRERSRLCSQVGSLFRLAAREWLGGKCAVCGSATNLNLDQTLPPAYQLGQSRLGSGYPSLCTHAAYYAVRLRAGHIQLLCHRCNNRLGLRRLPYWKEVLAKNPWKPHKP